MEWPSSLFKTLSKECDETAVLTLSHFSMDCVAEISTDVRVLTS